MTYPDSVQFLYALGNEMKTAKLGLERIQAVLRALGNARINSPVHVPTRSPAIAEGSPGTSDRGPGWGEG